METKNKQQLVSEENKGKEHNQLLIKNTELTIIHKEEEYELSLSKSEITSITQFIHEVYRRAVLDSSVRQISSY
jgi:hypothetical protein